MSRKLLLLLLGIYCLSAVASYGAFALMQSPMEQVEVVKVEDPEAETQLGSLLDISQDEPRDQACPLNGMLYTQTEREAWESRRPMAVMIENSPDARPQSGLSSADITFEAVAEGGVTRFMPIYYCDAQRFDVTLAPVRSARTYFVDWASGFNLPLYVHVGGANLPGPTDALGQISKYGWDQNNDINQFSVGYPTFVRNFNRIEGKEVATEHTMETSTERIWEVAEERGWTNITPERRSGLKLVPEGEWSENFETWTFETQAPEGLTADATQIEYDFWTGYSDYAVSWEYDAEADTYKRTMAGAPHIDLNNDQQIAVSNVVVLQTNEKGPINELKHMLYTTVGRGQATIFKHGVAEKVNWSKPTREAELSFTTLKGQPVEFAPGKVWISVLDTADTVTY